MQYRAIGLIQGTYVPSEEQFTRGTLMTEDNQPVDAVLLGRVMSLVKKHVDLTVPHLWVVYPRTRPKNEHLHAQIVGIWEPDKLHRVLSDHPDVQAEAEESSDIDVTTMAVEPPPVTDNSGNPDEENTAEESTAIVQPGPAESGDLSPVVDADADADTTLSTPEAETPVPEPEPLAVSESISPTTEVEIGAVEPEATDHEVKSAASDAIAEEPDNNEPIEAVAPKLVKPSRPKFSVAAAQVANSPAPIPNPPQTEPSQVPPRSEPSSHVNSLAQPILKDGYFSVRGEVIQFSPEDEQITIRIRQANRKGVENPNPNDKANHNVAKEKEFKLQLRGRLEGRTVGYFWELQVQREGNNLVVFDSNLVGVVPPRKNRRRKGPGGPPRGGRGPKRRF
ncbi:MAG: hypothetical protein F6K30_16565, partial [Cyanothece sp. SIO2G6]|nr:hypothetical protein [Cyanothece sp. SIO2G6]